MNERRSLQLLAEKYEQVREIAEIPEQSDMTKDSQGNKYWKLKNGKFHRLDGPAVIGADGSKAWFINGKEYTEQEFEINQGNGSTDVNSTEF